MKQTIFLTVLAAFFVAASVNAQVSDPKNVAKRQGTNRANSHIESGVDKGFDKIEEGIGSLFGKKKKKKKGNSTESKNESASKAGNSTHSVKGKDVEQLFAEHGMYPPEGATDVPLPVTLKWTAMNSSDFKAKGYELYLEEGETNPMKMMGGPRKSEFSCKNLLPNTTYSWKYVGQSSSGQYMPGGGGTFTTGDGTAAPATMEVRWSKFDFVPGDEVIFADDPDVMEENGEFPSRWDLHEGSVEIASANGETVIMFLTGGGIVPYMKNAKEDYLPEVFTLECDMYFTPGESGRYWIAFHDKKNQRHIGDNIEVFVNGIECGASEMRYPGTEDFGWSQNKKGGWKHISVAFTHGKLKAYMDDTRLINIPHYEGNPTGITISAEKYDYQPFIKNIRIAKGGVKYYDRVMQDGKIICNGIRFDVNKATLKPESMGPINKICQLMQKQPDLKFSVEGHTDSDGDDGQNQSLSEQRAKAVMNQLVAMGISVERLSSKGFGESQPLDNNNTPEGKANNRRVEFVRK
jgi:outer membrane protein OmpA-like peptidoglycan-associated protein